MQKIKKPMALILSVLLLFSFFSVAVGMSASAADNYKVTATGNNELIADKAKMYNADDEFDLKLSVKASELLISGTVFLNFNSNALFAVSAEKGAAMTENITFLPSGFNNEDFQNKNNFVKLTFSSFLEASDYTTESVLFTVHFKAKNTINSDESIYIDIENLDGTLDVYDINSQFPFVDRNVVIDNSSIPAYISAGVELTGGTEPATEPPTTQEPTTQTPTTQAPTTQAPTTQPPTTQAPTTQAPTTQTPTTQTPTTQAPTTQEPTTQAPTTQAPTTQAPTTQAPTTQAPTTQAPTTQAPTTQAPTTQAPTTQAPTTQAPTTQAPTTQAPTTQAPTTQAPTTQAPTTQAPTTQAPTTEPIAKQLIRFVNNKSWSKVNLYAWENGGSEMVKWPGTAMNKTGEKNSDGQDYYELEIDKKYNRIIFNNGSEQTVDIVVNPDATGYYLTEKGSDGKWRVASWIDDIDNTQNPETENYTFYYLPSTANFNAGYSYKLNYNDTYGTNPENWHPFDFTVTENKVGNVSIYSVSVPKYHNSAAELQYQVYNGSNWISQIKFDNVNLSDYDNKIVLFNGNIAPYEALVPPTTAPLPTQEPTTQAPTTQAPTTQAPTTQAPTTQASTTQAPTTQAPTTQAPTTQAPTTQAPTTQAPTTQAPTTQAPTTQAPTTQAPTTAVMTTLPEPETYLFYYKPSSKQENAGYTYKLSFNDINGYSPDNWHHYTFTKTPIKLDNTYLYSVNVPKTLNSVRTLQYQVFDGDTWESQISYNNVNLSDFDNFIVETEEEPETPTEAPTTEAPTTEVPTTEAPTTEAPTTEAPTTEVPTTEVPTTEVPTTDPVESTTVEPTEETTEALEATTAEATTQAVESTSTEATEATKKTESTETTEAPETTEVSTTEALTTEAPTTEETKAVETTSTQENQTTTPALETKTFSYLPSDEQVSSGYNYKLAVQDNKGYFTNYDFVMSDEIINGINVYKAEVPIKNNIIELYYQVYDSDNNWISQIIVSPESADGEIINSDGTVYTSEPQETTIIPTTAQDTTAAEVTEPQTSVFEPTSIAPTEATTSKPETKKANPVKITVKAKTLKAKKLKKKAQTVKAITVKNAKTALIYKLVKKGTTKKIYKKLKISKSGVITFKKGKYAKKLYKIRVKITAKSNSKYKSKTINKTIKVRVK